MASVKENKIYISLRPNSVILTPSNQYTDTHSSPFCVCIKEIRLWNIEIELQLAPHENIVQGCLFESGARFSKDPNFVGSEKTFAKMP